MNFKIRGKGVSREKLIVFAATGGLTGKSPVAPGTFGTLPGIVVVIFFNGLAPAFLVFAVVCLILVAVWLSDEAEKILGGHDPGAIVIDEIAGFSVAMAGLPVTPYTLGAGFVIFRFFDIVKPPPVRYFEKNFCRGPGIVLDDIAAGLFTHIILYFIV